jgi:hypothetical protein
LAFDNFEVLPPVTLKTELGYGEGSILIKSRFNHPVWGSGTVFIEEVDDVPLSARQLLDDRVKLRGDPKEEIFRVVSDGYIGVWVGEEINLMLPAKQFRSLLEELHRGAMPMDFCIHHFRGEVRDLPKTDPNAPPLTPIYGVSFQCSLISGRS